MVWGGGFGCGVVVIRGHVRRSVGRSVGRSGVFAYTTMCVCVTLVEGELGELGEVGLVGAHLPELLHEGLGPRRRLVGWGFWTCICVVCCCLEGGEGCGGVIIGTTPRPAQRSSSQTTTCLQRRTDALLAYRVEEDVARELVLADLALRARQRQRLLDGRAHLWVYGVWVDCRNMVGMCVKEGGLGSWQHTDADA